MIRLKCGVYGAKDGMKRASDGPFSLSDAEEARLVKRGVAEYIFDHHDQPDHDEGVKLPRYDVGMTMKQLQGIAAYFGLDASKLRSKQAVVDMLDAHLSAAGAPEEPPEEDPDHEDEETGESDDDGEGEGDGTDPDAPALGAAEPTV